MRVIAALAASATLLGAWPARAHVRLLSPTSRYGDEMKVGPCGRLGGTRTANVTTFAPGATVTVVFEEFIRHPGHYRIAFDPAGDDDLAPPAWDGVAWVTPPGVQVLADFLPDPPAGSRGEVQVRLPDLECDTCTLQLVQVMTDKPPFDGLDDHYYQCADLRLLADAPPPPPPPAPAPEAAPPPGGGCSSGGAAAPASLALALAAWLRRRRSPEAPCA